MRGAPPGRCGRSRRRQGRTLRLMPPRPRAAARRPRGDGRRPPPRGPRQQRTASVAAGPPVLSAPPAPVLTRTAPRPPHPRRGPARAARGAPLLLTLAGVVLLALGELAAGIVLAVLGVALVAAAARLGDPHRLAGAVGGRPAASPDDARLLNLVDGLCVASGLAMPEVRVLEDEAANAVVLGSSHEHAVLVVTSGLVAALDRIELEGVLAHELAHLRRGDTAVAADATRAMALLARIWSQTPLVVMRLAGATREAGADLAAVRVTRYPPGLGAALDKLATRPTRPAALDPVTARLTAPLWCAPLAEGQPPTPVRGALAVAERAAMLHEL